MQNPRYTGRQVWNRLRTDEVLIDVEDIALGHENRHRWNDPSEWIWSKTESHTPLISTEMYERAQQTVKARGTRSDTGKAPRRSHHPYLFRGLIRCALCGRLMAGSVNHGRIYYRCKASRDYVRQHGISHPPVLYVRQESIVDPVDHFLNEELGHNHLTETLHRIADASHRAALAAHDPTGEAPNLHDTIADRDTKIGRYRATLDAGGDPALVAGWIAETTAIKKAAQARLSLTEAPPERMSEDQIAAIVDALAGLLGLLKQADRRDRVEIYSRIGLRMTYRPGTETVLAEVVSSDLDRVPKWCPRRDTNQNPTRSDPVGDDPVGLSLGVAAFLLDPVGEIRSAALLVSTPCWLCCYVKTIPASCNCPPCHPTVDTRGLRDHAYSTIGSSAWRGFKEPWQGGRPNRPTTDGA